MYFIIFVMSWFVVVSVNHFASSVDKGLVHNGKHFQRGIWLILANCIKGFNLGYTVWFIYYCVVNYLYQLL